LHTSTSSSFLNSSQTSGNGIVQISKFIWAVTSCEGRPTADVFAHHYELHYQNKKIHFEGSETTFTTQFGCISFHPSWFGHRLRLIATMRNKWTSGWDGNGFYYRVPSDQKADFHGLKTYSLSSKMTKLDYVMEVLSSCGLEDANFIAFIEATSLIDGHDVVEEFLACGPLANSMAFKWRQKNHPCLRFWCRCRRSEAEFVARIEKAKNELVG
jgi:hypothetical protein